MPSNFQVAYWNGSVTVTANPVANESYYQYEEKKNSKKEKIQLVRKEFIEDFVAKYYQVINRGGSTTIGISAEGVNMA